MADVQLPKYSDLLWPTLQALTELGGSGRIAEILDKIIEIEGFTEEQQAALHGDGPNTAIAYRAAWARTYLKKVGAVDNSERGVWALTEVGTRLRAEDTEAIPARVRAQWKESESVGHRVEASDEADVAKSAEDWRERVLDTILDAPADAFERLAQRLLREADFVSVKVTGRSGDQGIDGVGIYRLSLVGFPVFFQCKRFRGSVGAGAVRDFRGAMAGRGDKGLLITTGTFTSAAKEEAVRPGAPPIDLIDGHQLCELLKKYGLGVHVTERIVEDIEVDTEFFHHA